MEDERYFAVFFSDESEIDEIVGMIDNLLNIWYGYLLEAATCVRQVRKRTKEQHEQNLRDLAAAELAIRKYQAIRSQFDSKNIEMITESSNQAVTWTDADEDQAHKEEWCIYNGLNASWFEIQKLYYSSFFRSNHEAWEYVQRRAEEGSKFHQRAIHYVVKSWQGNQRIK